MPDIDLVHAYVIDKPEKNKPTALTRFSRPVWVGSGLGQFLLFCQPGMLYAYRTDGMLRWSIQAQVAITGFTMDDDHGDSLYVQDGPVLCHYSLDSLQGSVVVTLPSNALAFDPTPPKSWYRGDTEASFKALFDGASATDTYSAPLYVADAGDGDRVYVLRSDGQVFAARPNLDPVRLSWGNTGNIPDQPDQPGEPPQPALYLDASESQARLCFISGGQVVVLPDDRIETPSEGIQAWRQNCLLTMTEQPWMPLVSPAQGFIGAGPTHSQAAAITLADPTAGTWSFHLVDPACYPASSNAGSMQVQDQASGATVTHANPGIPAGLVISTPPPLGHEWSGTLPVVKVLSAPYLLEDGARFVYVIAVTAQAGGTVPALCKFKLLDPSDSYILRWWQAVQCAHDKLQPILAAEIVLTLADTVPAGFAPGSPSPLWSATQQGSVPWDKFNPAASIYVPLVDGTPGTVVTPIDASVPQSIMQFYNVTSRPSAPLFGPRAVPDGTTDYFVLSNRWGLYGFTPAGALAWRIPARLGFVGWIPAGKFLLVTEGTVLSAYDTSRFPSDGSDVLYPDQWIDVEHAPQSVMTDRDAFNVRIANDGVGWPPVAPKYPPDSYVPYQTDPNTIHLHTQYGAQNDIAIGFDPSNGLIPGSGNPSSPFTSPPGLQTDLTVDAPQVNWRPASPALPAGVALLPDMGEFNGLIQALMAPPQMSVTAEPIDICGNVFWVPTSELPDFSATGFLYCCLARRQQYFFVQFPVLVHPLPTPPS